jgi:hypothetical protein
MYFWFTEGVKLFVYVEGILLMSVLLILFCFQAQLKSPMVTFATRRLHASQDLLILD